MTTYAERIAANRALANAWQAPHRAEIRAQAAMVALHAEALAAAIEGRDLGVSIALHADGFALSFRGRSSRFRRHRAAIYRIDHGDDGRELALPDTAVLTKSWAIEQIVEALDVLTR